MTNIHARDVELKLAASVSITAGTVLDTAFSSGVTVITAKSWELDEGEFDFEQQNYHGEDANGYQNQGKVRAAKGPATMTITVDAEDLSSIQALLYDKSVTAGGTHTTYSMGNDTRKTVAVLANLDAGSIECNYAMLNAEQTAPAVRTTGEEGVVEYELSLKCLGRDFRGPQWKN